MLPHPHRLYSFLPTANPPTPVYFFPLPFFPPFPPNFVGPIFNLYQDISYGILTTQVQEPQTQPESVHSEREVICISPERS